MPVTVKVNGAANSLVHKMSNGVTTATIPDVCKTPSPGGPVPIPYPNIAQSAMLAKGTTTVKADGAMAAIKGSEFSISNGDEPGVAGGVKSSTFIKEATWILYSFDVKLDGKNACRLGDKMLHNHENTANTAGELQPPVPVIATGADGSTKACAASGGVGNPVNPVLGAKYLADAADVDFTLSGPMELVWQRRYLSSQAAVGWLGQGWTTPLEMSIERHPDGLAFVDPSSGTVLFPPLDVGGVFRSKYVDSTLRRPTASQYEVESHDGTRFAFRMDDPFGRGVLAGVRDRNGNRWEVELDPRGLPHRVTDSAGRLLYLEFDGAERLVEIGELRLPATASMSDLARAGEAGRNRVPLVRYSFTPAGDLAAVADRAGTVTRRFRYKNHLLVAHASLAGLVSTYEYDVYTPAGRVLVQQDNAGRQWQFSYEDLNTKVRDRLGRMQTFKFNQLGRLTAVIDAAGQTTRRVLDRYGNLTMAVDANNAITRYEYDDDSRLVRTVLPSQHETRVEWDPALGLPVEITDCLGFTSTYRYDDRGNLVAEQAADGSLTQYVVDERGLPVQVIGPSGGVKSLEWNTNAQLVRYTDESGSVTSYAYDAWGQLERVTDPLGGVTTRRYDARGDLVAVVNADGAIEHRSYDQGRRLVEHVDGDGSATRYEYTADGRLLRRIDALGGVFAYEYDEIGRLAAVINENGARHAFTYDELDRVREELSFDGRLTRYSYDAVGHVIRQVELPGAAEEITTQFEYDPSGRVVHKTVRGYGISIVRRFKWDALNRLTEARDDRSRVRLDWDPMGRLEAETVAVRTTEGECTTVLRHEYDPLGNRIATTLPTGRKLTMLRAAGGHVSQLELDGEPVSRMQRDAAHRERLRTQGRLITRFEHDGAGRLTSQETVKDGIDGRAPVRRRDYRYDGAHRPVEIDDTRNGSIRIRYDRLDRPVAALVGDRAMRFAFDPAHNRINPAGAPAVATDRVRTLGDQTFEFDAHGRVIEKRAGDGKVIRFTWDLEHRLITSSTITRAEVSTTHYEYDVFSRRIAKRGAGDAVFYCWDRDRLLDMWRAGRRTTFVYEPDSFRPLAQLVEAGADGLSARPQVRYYHADQVGMPCTITSDAGDVLWDERFDPFGAAVALDDSALADGSDVAAEDAADMQPLRFQGQMFDRETGLHYNRFRYYDPDAGFFLTPDPVGFAGGENPYAYGSSAPTVYFDPLGLARITDPQAQIEYEAYKKRCNESVPAGLDACAAAKWKLARNQDCRRMRQAWDDKWLPGRHAGDIANLDKSIQKLQDFIKLNCP